MPLLVTCPRCRVRGHLPDGSPGGVIGCPRCGTEFDIPPSTVQRPARDKAPAGGTEVLGTESDLGVWVGPAAPLEQTPPPHRTPAGSSPRHEIAPGPTSAPDLGPESGSTLDWLRQEVDRFNAFVSAQLAQIRGGREGVARAATAAETAAVTREQELNRQAAALTGRAAELDRRAAELDRRAAELARRVAEFERRAAAVERQEAAVRGLIEEADEIEDDIRVQYEALERDLVQRRRVGDAVFRRPAADSAE